MHFTSSELQIQKITQADGTVLEFIFSGKFSEKISIQSTIAWHEELEDHPTTNYRFVWDCTHMTGFEVAARLHWQKYLNLHRDQIVHVTVIARNSMIRNAARMMFKLIGFSYSIEKKSSRTGTSLKMI